MDTGRCKGVGQNGKKVQNCFPDPLESGPTLTHLAQSVVSVAIKTPPGRVPGQTSLRRNNLTHHGRTSLNIQVQERKLLWSWRGGVLLLE